MRQRLAASFPAAFLAAAFLFTQVALAREPEKEADTKAADAKSTVIVFAAASMKNALDELSSKWEQKTGHSVKISYAASSTLAKQLEQDAPASIFISADEDWMNYVEKKALIQSDTRTNLLGNKLVLIAPKSSAVTLDLKPGADLAKALGGGRIAMGNVDSVPAGKYGKAALEKLGLWDAVSGKIAQAESVRAALALVSRGEAPLGIVYKTDAAADPNVKVVATFPADSHPAIIYPIALTANAKGAAGEFLTFLKSPEAVPAFEAQGFTVLSVEKEKKS